MKSTSKLALVLLCGMLTCAAWGQDAGSYQAAYQAGEAHLRAGKFAEARAEFEKALAVEGVTDAQKVDVQLQIGTSYYEEKDYARARPELEKVLTMPRADELQERDEGWSNYAPSREARLRLLKIDPASEKEKSIAVFFIGSSLTLRGYMPYVVEEVAASAPAGRPRIITGKCTRGGTGIEVFWEDGETRGTSRGMMSAVPWDFVVVETSMLRAAESNLKYGKLFCDFARSKNIKPVIYETHITQEKANPAAQQKYHDDEVALAKAAQCPLAPVMLAEMYYIEANPTAKIGMFYDDWIHPSETCIYLTAYCIYSTITGYSPVGLSHPGSISGEEAKSLQEAAWKAVQEANPDLKAWK